VEGSDRVRTRLVAYKVSGEIQTYVLGPHAPTLTREDLDLIHRLWLEAVAEVGIDVHHRDVVRVALEKLQREIEGVSRHEAMALIARQAGKPSSAPADPPAPDQHPGAEC
jgi:hypothetical protein